MFNISNKEKIIEFLCKIYSWQQKDFNKASFELKDYGFPLYLLTINDVFNINDSEETPETIYLKNNIEIEIYDYLNVIDFPQITNKNIDLALNLNPTVNEKTNFTLLTHNGEIYCILNTNNHFTFNIISSNHKKIDFHLLNNLKDILYILSTKQSS